MLITSDRKATPAKRVYMVCLFLLTLGASLTMIIDNAPTQPAEVERQGPLRKLICFVLAAGLLCAGLYMLSVGSVGMLIVGALLITVGAGWLREDFIAPRDIE